MNMCSLQQKTCAFWKTCHSFSLFIACFITLWATHWVVCLVFVNCQQVRSTATVETALSLPADWLNRLLFLALKHTAHPHVILVCSGRFNLKSVSIWVVARLPEDSYLLYSLQWIFERWSQIGTVCFFFLSFIVIFAEQMDGKRGADGLAGERSLLGHGSLPTKNKNWFYFRHKSLLHFWWIQQGITCMKISKRYGSKIIWRAPL